MRLGLRVRYMCGCEENVRTDINLPDDLANAPRSEENDQKIIRYITENYNVENWYCGKKHRYATKGFDKIVEILN